jgi:hypothetical protein
VNKEMCIDIIRRLRDAVRRKPPGKWRASGWYLFHDNAPAHRSVLVKDFLLKNNVSTMERLPHFPDLTAADFYLFPWMKSASKGRRFCDSTDIFQNAA